MQAVHRIFLWFSEILAWNQNASKVLPALMLCNLPASN